MYVVETITDAAGLAQIAPEWAALDAGLSPRTPFSSPLWCATWWRHFARSGLGARDRMRVLAVRDGDRLVAVAPMMLTSRPSVGPIRARELQFFGADAYMTELRGPVCRPEDAEAVVAALDAHLKACASEWDWVQWRGLRKAEPAAEWAHAALPLDRYAELTDHYLPLPPTWDAFRAALPRNIKESLRKCYNSLARDGHAFEFRAVAAPEDVEAALRRFLELHRGRAQVTGTVDHLDVFAKPETRRFLLDYGRALAQAGDLRVFQLTIGGAVVATRIGIVLGQELYLYYSGYDPDWSRYSVMTTAVAESIRWAIEHGFTVVNLSTGTDVSKMRWRPQQVVFAGGYQVSPTMRARLAFASLEAVRRRRRA
ncbi:GNAT family N-acetyltransferase [Methylobacterium sp. NEAU K]|uniref:GNAT family N-acetyltransferase n=1 Tax=Methylobacterium sp. NEAU K TaxID=3064946 RepID=UPI0027323EDA|nr:GNAT family N-acetyltransferase [Methylobacterium sp. NEAU K]MDP4006127.1 GNAT family N-acetyltransferase [Methylobacterium sp. NEAU K]